MLGALGAELGLGVPRDGAWQLGCAICRTLVACTIFDWPFPGDAAPPLSRAFNPSFLQGIAFRSKRVGSRIGCSPQNPTQSSPPFCRVVLPSLQLR